MHPFTGPTTQGLGLDLRTLTLPSGRISYVDEGEGPVLLLMHGAPFTALGFIRVIAALRDRYRVIAPDMPGYGRSTAAPTFSHTLAGYAAFIEEFCAELGLRHFVLFGCDSSGLTSLSAAATMASRVAGLVIADTAPIPLTGRAWPVKLLLRHVITCRFMRWVNRKFNLLVRLVFTIDPLRRPFQKAERRVLIGEYDTLEKRDRIMDVFAAMGRDDAFMRATERRVRRQLSEKPALLLFGQFDPMRLAGGISRYKELFKRSTVHLVSREKHFPIFAAGTEVGHAIGDWMDTLGLNQPRARPSNGGTRISRTKEQGSPDLAAIRATGSH